MQLCRIPVAIPLFVWLPYVSAVKRCVSQSFDKKRSCRSIPECRRCPSSSITPKPSRGNTSRQCFHLIREEASSRRLCIAEPRKVSATGDIVNETMVCGRARALSVLRAALKAEAVSAAALHLEAPGLSKHRRRAALADADAAARYLTRYPLLQRFIGASWSCSRSVRCASSTRTNGPSGSRPGRHSTQRPCRRCCPC